LWETKNFIGVMYKLLYKWTCKCRAFFIPAIQIKSKYILPDTPDWKEDKDSWSLVLICTQITPWF